MRMFLIGMCDIFLLLYLTTLTKSPGAPVSVLTVKDYLALEQSAKELEDKKAAQEKELLQLTDKLAQAKIELSGKENALARATDSSQEVTKKADNLAADKQKLLAELQELEAQRKKLAELSAEQQKLALLNAARLEAEAKAAEAQNQKLSQDLTTLAEKSTGEIELAALRAAEAKKSETEALRKAEEAEQRASRSDAAAARAQAEASLAENRATVAEQQKKLAVATAEQAKIEKRDALIQETVARQRAEVAEREKTEIKTKVEEITQPTTKAYLQNVRTKALPFVLKTKIKTLLGSERNEKSLLGVPAITGSEQLLFVSLNELGINQESEANDYRRFELFVGKTALTALYISRSKPAIAALVIPGQRNPAQMPLAKAKFSELMPTLIALRNNTPLGFFDNLRDVSSDYFVFKRDDLRPDKSGLLRYQAQGIRGTGDFAQYLLSGDTIVDLNGNLVALAISKTEVMPITGIEGWQRIELQGLNAKKPSAKEVVRQLVQASR